MISDIGLPNEDGFQLMRSIRSLTSGASNNIPSIALTAFAGDQDRTRAFESGFNIFLTKPIEPDDLVRSIMELCRP
jgi:CheY-like chemotaxis protein